MRSGRAAHCGDRLFRYDRRIAINAGRATLSGWHDRLVALTIVASLSAAIYLRADGVSPRPLFAAAFATGFVVAGSIGGLLVRRFAFHASDGQLAADALNPTMRRRYDSVWQATGFAAIAASATAAGPFAVMGVVLGYPLGALAAALGGPAVRGLRRRHGGRAEPTRWRLVRRHQAIAGAALILLALALGRLTAVGSPVSMILAGVTTFGVTLGLTRIDDQTVRFAVFLGHTPYRILLRHTRATAGCIALVLPPALLLLDPRLALTIAAVSTVMLVVMALRILAYALHGTRFADTLVAIILALLVAIATAAPFVAPAVAAVILWRLLHRVAARRWLYV